MGKPTRCTIWSCRNKTDVEILVDDIYCYGLALDKSGFLYVSDWKKNEVRRWKRGEKNGTVVAGGNREERRLNQLSWPTFLFIDEDNSLFISDFLNHRVMKWTKDAKQGIVVAGGKDEGDGPNQLNSRIPMVYRSMEKEIFTFQIIEIIEYKNLKLIKQI